VPSSKPGHSLIIGTRWPVRDEDAALLFDAFYAKLGAGASLSEALAHAKNEAIDAGRPAATWASLVLLGDGSFRPFPEGRRETPMTFWIMTSLAVGIVVLLAIVTYRGSHHRQ
jgi:hypothetical protein